MGIVWELLSNLAGATIQKTAEESLSSDYRNDPVYKQNVQKLIEHHRQFVKKE
jgi:hypothetical protein